MDLGWEMKIEKFILSLFQKAMKPLNYFKSKSQIMHAWCTDNGVYFKTLEWFGNIMLSGIIIWLMLIPFVGLTRAVYVPCYGLMPWFVIEFVRQVRK